MDNNNTFLIEQPLPRILEVLDESIIIFKK